MRKKALIITYHLKNCKREGGFHHFIKYLEEFSYDIDWLTCPVSISWIFHNNDKENAKNFFTTWRGINYEENGVYVRHFSVPILIPAKLAKAFGMKLGKYYWADWKNVKKRLDASYDVILVEGVGCQYAADIRKDYPNANIIYRPSDILETFSEVPNAMMLEKNMIEIARVTACVDENEMNYYNEIVSPNVKMEILRNPLTKEEDIQFTREWKPVEKETKIVLYIGVSMVDLDLIEFAAKQNREADFIVIGPFSNKSHDNIKYLGSMSKEQYLPYLENASVGIQPLISKSSKIIYGYTRKTINYMRYLLPIVTTKSDNYLNVEGFMVANNEKEFSDMITTGLRYSLEEREGLREGYVRAMEVFLENRCKDKFKELL